jgi:hypothetical protein
VSAIPKQKLTPDEYLARERLAEFKSEYVDGELFPVHAVAGAKFAHNRIKRESGHRDR